MERYECVRKGDIYYAEISDSVWGGVNLTIWKQRQGREPKSVLNKRCNSHFDAQMEMEKYLPDTDWRNTQGGK